MRQSVRLCSWEFGIWGYHLARNLSLVQGDMNRRPGTCAIGVADYHRVIVIPADRVATCENGQRTEVLQAPGKYAEACVRAIARADRCSGQTTIRGLQAA